MFSKSILSVKNLTKFFDQKKIINNISFDLKEKEILGLIGNNGSGKTTIFKILLNILNPDSGSIEYFNKDLFKFRSEILEKVSFVNNYVKLPSKLTLKENLSVYLNLYNSNNFNKLDEYLNFFDLHKYKDKKTEILSSGENLKLMLIKAFITDPKIVLLDEPTSQVDKQSSNKIRDFILKKKEEDNLSIIIISHDNKEIDYLCNRVLVLKDGNLYKN